ncbi:MAG: PAS domain S-box protein, partial [Desulfobulbaceae bacterium]|nr:PAS domain S-box protein [Desulfobulbaceae bacterium]
MIGKYNLLKDVVIEKQGVMPDIKRVFEKGEVASILIDYDFGAVDHVDVKKATHKIINSILTPVLDSSGKVSNVIVQTIDLTEIKRAEGALRQSEKKYRRLVENAVVGVYQVTKEGIFRFVNEKMAEMFGYDKPESLMDEVVNIVDLYVRPEERPALLRELDENGFIHGREVEFRKKDGGSVWLALSTRRTRDEGHIIYEGLMADITERKELEKELQQAQKMEAIGTLSGGIAHDFNNILGIILGNTELAMDDVPEWNPARRNLKEVRKACLRAKDVIQQILSFSRQTDSEKKPIKIAPIVRESLTLLRASIPTSIEIRSNVEAAEDTILGNSTQIHQILINLCGNATHAMEEAGGILEVHLKNISLDVRAASQYHDIKPGPYVKLSVKDTGHGIDTQTMKRIFDPYFTTKDVGKGTGMGLAMVHGIVKRHNGAISVQSKPGSGSSFDIFFPLVEQVQPEAPKELDKLPRGHERILFVDDENSIVEFNKQRLERLGYTVETRTDSVKALALFLSNPDAFDLVITDMTMPSMTGDALARELLKIRPDLPIILCTGYSARMSEEKAMELG